MKTITVLLADDHRIVREGFRSLLNLTTDIKVIAEATNGREALALGKLHRPDVMVMDLAMPLLNGLEAARQMLAEHPDGKIIILSGHNDDASIDRVMEVGAAGYLSKQTSGESLADAIREVHAGNRFFSPLIRKRLENGYEKSRGSGEWQVKKGLTLTPRELEVIQLIAESYANKQVAADLGISIKTVEKHRQHVMDKLNIHDTAGLTRYAIAHGIIESAGLRAIV